MQDRNFDDLAHRFKNRIYGGLKGEIRLAVLNRDLAPVLQQPPAQSLKNPATESRALKIVDAGGGQGQFALDLAEMGHRVTLADISAEMLELAEAQRNARGLQDRLTLLHQPLQELRENKSLVGVDLVLCHAVLEWLQYPQQAISQLKALLRPGGYLSLTFYNRRGLEFRLLQRGSLRQLERNQNSGDWSGHPGGLTPNNPLLLEEVEGWLAQAGLTIVAHSGIRCFHDFMTPVMRDKLPGTAIVEKELEYSRQDPYRQLARYVHLLCRL